MSFYLLPDLACYARCFETLHFLGFVCNGLFPTIVCNFVVYFFLQGGVIIVHMCVDVSMIICILIVFG